MNKPASLIKHKKQLVLQRQISLPGKKLLETVKNSRGRCKESTLNE